MQERAFQGADPPTSGLVGAGPQGTGNVVYLVASQCGSGEGESLGREGKSVGGERIHSLKPKRKNSSLSAQEEGSGCPVIRVQPACRARPGGALFGRSTFTRVFLRAVSSHVIHAMGRRALEIGQAQFWEVSMRHWAASFPAVPLLPCKSAGPCKL